MANIVTTLPTDAVAVTRGRGSENPYVAQIKDAEAGTEFYVVLGTIEDKEVASERSKIGAGAKLAERKVSTKRYDSKSAGVIIGVIVDSAVQPEGDTDETEAGSAEASSIDQNSPAPTTDAGAPTGTPAGTTPTV